MAEELEIEVLNEEHLSNSEAYKIVKDIVNRIQRHEGSVPLLLVKTLSYLSKFAEKIPPEKAISLRKALRKYGLKEETIVMIINVCPKTLDELRTLLEIEEKVIDTETASEILELVKTYCHSDEAPTNK